MEVLDRKEFAPVEITKDPSIVKDLFGHTRVYHEWDEVDYQTPYTLVELASRSREYRNIEAEFTKPYENFLWVSLREIAKVEKIVRVQNPFLQVQYELKLKQKKYIHGRFTENLLYHGTKSSNVDSICRNNFDWRKVGTNNPPIFGQGVCFSRSAYYSSTYPDILCPDHLRAMILVKEMEVSRCQGHGDMVIPPLPDDTSADLMFWEQVVVKYFDNEFYPGHILYYKFNHNYHVLLKMVPYLFKNDQSRSNDN